MTRITSKLLLPCVLTILLAGGPVSAARPAPASGVDWPYWRGPDGDGVADATGLPDTWSVAGDNVAWTSPFGGRSAPVVFGDRLYLQNSVGEHAEMQERVVALNADTGAVLWEHRFNVTLSDVPPHRVGWASPTVDPATGNIYALGVDGRLLGLSPDGEPLWEHFLSEELGIISTHGGRTPSPIVCDDVVVVSGVMGGWGSLARGWHRFVAADTRTGAIAWVSSPGSAPYDTTYAPPLLATVDGRELLIDGAGDGSIVALQPTTGKQVWRYAMSKRGVNTGAIVVGDRVLVSHGEENLEDATMGLVAAVDVRARGEIEPGQEIWAHAGVLGGYSTGVSDGELFYVIDNAANLTALDVASGETLWTHSLGTIQRASPVLADGKLYTGTTNGDFYILRPSRAGVQVLDHEQLTHGNDIEEIIASVAVARGRIYLVSTEHVYAIGPREPVLNPERPVVMAPVAPAVPAGEVAAVAVYPQELVMAPGDEVSFEARLYDAEGRFLDAQPTAVSWTVAGGAGEIDAEGRFVAAPHGPRAGAVTAAVGGVEGAARLRVFPPLPWSFDFDGMESVPPFWVGALGKFRPETVEGNGVLVKTNDNPFLKRTKVFLGGSELHDYTVQVDLRSDLDRRRLADAGLIAQRYSLILFGTKQSLELQSWQPETERTIAVPFAARPDTWYRMKLRTTNLEDGSVRVQGKLWERDQPEPAEWAVDVVDRRGETRGSPGLYADAHALVTFDNLTVQPNP